MIREACVGRAVHDVEEEVLAFGRKAAKAAAFAVLPSTMLRWRGPRDKPRVALTFDDGPTTTTRHCLDLLERFGARATFFLVGAFCAAERELVGEIVARGHEVAGHGYTHRTFTSLSREELEAELDRTKALLPDPHTGRCLVRPPHGAVSVRSLMTCANLGYTTVLWSRDSEDWRTREAHRLVEDFDARPVCPGEILLFHEGQEWTLAALPAILDRLVEDNHELVTVSELFDC